MKILLYNHMENKLRFLFSLPSVYHLWIKKQYDDEWIDYYQDDFDKANFSDGRYEDCETILGDPFRDAGTAARLFNKYDLALSVGLSFGEIRVFLYKDLWLFPIVNNSTVDLGLFIDTPKEDINVVFGFGQSLNEAVCKCLVHCRRAGVI